MTKHRILIEFEASKPLPADFTDIVLNRIYMLDCVNKKECTATLVGDVLKDAERYQWLRKNIENSFDDPYAPQVRISQDYDYALPGDIDQQIDKTRATKDTK